jgi:lipase chaperone LimK
VTRWQVIGGATLCVALLVGYGRWLASPAPVPIVHAPAVVAEQDVATTAGVPHTQHGDSTAPAEHRVASSSRERLLVRWQASSQRGSDADGEIGFDPWGRIRVDAGLRRLFDYALTLQGEFSVAEIRVLLEHWVEARHGGSTAAQALVAFDRYVALKHAESSLALITDPGERLTALQVLRRQHFGAEAEALFGDEEAYARYTLERLALLQSEALSAAQRTEQLAALDASRDPGQRAAEALAQAPVVIAEHESQLAALGADAAQRHQERSALWGEEAAIRLAALDAQEADWTRRLAAFVAARDQILADPLRDAAARDQALTALLGAQFTEAERRRVQSLLRMGGPSGG